MAEMLVFAIDKIGNDVYKNAKLPKRGDVITIQEDGWPWGTEELSNPMFRIIKIPQVDPEHLQSFLSWEKPTSPLKMDELPMHLTNTLQFRSHKFDLDHPALISMVQDESRREPIIVYHAHSREMLALRIRKPSIDDPGFIGLPDNMIG